MTKRALRKFLQGFRVPAVDVCTATVPELEGYEETRVVEQVDSKGTVTNRTTRTVHHAPGLLKLTFTQGKVSMLDEIWRMLEDMYEVKEEGTPQQKGANDAEQKKET